MKPLIEVCVYVPWGQEIMTRKCYDKEIPGHWDNGTNGLLAPLTLVLWVVVVVVVVGVGVGVGIGGGGGVVVVPTGQPLILRGYGTEGHTRERS